MGEGRFHGPYKRDNKWRVVVAIGRRRAVKSLPQVTPHGLRGTAATIATPNGAVSHQVAAALGHSSTAITASAYVDKAAAQQATQRAAMRVLAGGRK